MRVELITIGDELLLGLTVDTNAAYLARELGAVGVEIVRRATVGDVAADIANAVADALARTGAVVTTGGLGPTSDDMTKPAIATLFGRELEFDTDTYERIERRWQSRGLRGPLPATNRQQALIPRGAIILANDHGTAPGIWLEDAQGRWVAMLPGVPREMRAMVADRLIPRLRAGAQGASTVVRSRTLRTTGIAESAAAERLGPLAGGVEGMPLAYLPGLDGVDLRVTARGLPDSEADALLESAAARLREMMGAFVYGEGTMDLAAVVLDACRKCGLHLAVGESCTGGLLGARLTSVPGSSEVFLGGVIAYDNSIKESMLGVSPGELADVGAVSEPVATAMARGARTRTGADIGVAITGIAGPTGGSPTRPIGTVWIALDHPGPQFQVATEVRHAIFVGDREEIRYRSTQTALDMIRRALPTQRSS
jgi:nicotinamide-nucleotide amidase